MRMLMSSFLGYQGNGVWAGETTVTLLAALFAESLRDVCDEPWAVQYARTLDEIARTIHQRYMTLRFDEHFTDDARKIVFKRAVRRVLRELASAFNLPVERVRRLPHPEGVVVTGPTPTDALLRYVAITLLILEREWPGDETFEFGK
jgi:hypothetical protein